MNLPKQLALGSLRPAAQTACAALLASSLLMAQQAPAKDSFAPSKLELDFVAGAELFHKRPDPLATKLLNSTVFGTHITENLWEYWSLEQSFSGSTLADLTLLPFPGAPNSRRVDLEQRVWKMNFNPVYHLTPRGSRVRPFLTIGFTEAVFNATKDGKQYAQSLAPVPAYGFKTSFKPGINYGGGFKVRFTDLIGMRMDVRGLWTGAPTWGLPPTNFPAGTLYIPSQGSLHGMEATAGIVFNFGGRGAAPVAPRTARVFELTPIVIDPPSGKQGDTFTFTTTLNDSRHDTGIIYTWTVDGAVQTAGANGPQLRTSTLTAGPHQISVTARDPKDGATATQSITLTVGSNAPAVPLQIGAIRANPSTGCEGDSFTFTTQVSGGATNVTFAWTLDNAAQSASGPEFRTTIPAAGSHSVGVTAQDPSGATATQTTSVTVNPLPALSITDASDKNQVKFGETARLTALGNETPCSGPLTYTWNADMGAVRGSGASVTFDSSTVPFDPAKTFQPESRTATIVPTVRDQRGRTATGNPIKIVVNKDAQAGRLDDVIFGNGSSRVNNCAKRILIDELQALMNNNPDVDVLLIGHTDASEKGAGLDHQRVYNAAAVLTAGTGVCAKGDVSRIKASYAGTDQTSEFRSGFCGTSTRQKSDERKSDEIAADDAAAKNRRVEIWIIPKGAAMPPGAKDPQAVPVRIVKAKGCPK
jgi:outer membrane protein OmpA-like peptidoglycan-associated protein